MQCGDVYILTTEFVFIVFDVNREKLNYNYKISIIHMYVRCTKMYIFLTHKCLLMKSNACQNCMILFGTLSGHKCMNVSI